MKPTRGLFFYCFLLVFFGAQGPSPHASTTQCGPAASKLLDNSESIFPLFESLARRQGMSEELLGQIAMKSFEFRKIWPAKTRAKSFIMGEGDKAVRVTLIDPFEMQATTVTQIQYAIMMGKNPSHFVDQGQKVFLPGKFIFGKKVLIDLNLPVEQVSREDAQAFMAKLNQLQNDYIYRLPTDAEWEYAARGGTTTKYFFGDEPSHLDAYGWHFGNSGGRIHSVGQKKANPYGLYDMYGNVSEWVEDTVHLNSESPLRNGEFHTIRGGCYSDFAENICSASSKLIKVNGKSFFIGFRMVRSPR